MTRPNVVGKTRRFGISTQQGWRTSEISFRCQAEACWSNNDARITGMSVDTVTELNTNGSVEVGTISRSLVSSLFLPFSCPCDQWLPCYCLIGSLYEGKRPNHVQSPHYINNEPSNSDIIHVSSSLWMGSKGYPETSHISFPTSCHDPRALEHKDEKLIVE